MLYMSLQIILQVFTNNKKKLDVNNFLIRKTISNIMYNYFYIWYSIIFVCSE